MLNKGGGEKCYMLSGRELSIAWKDTPYFWRWTRLPESRSIYIYIYFSLCGVCLRVMADINTYFFVNLQIL